MKRRKQGWMREVNREQDRGIEGVFFPPTPQQERHIPFFIRLKLH